MEPYSEYRAHTIISTVRYFQMDAVPLLATSKYKHMHTDSTIKNDAKVDGRTKFSIDAKIRLAGRAHEATSRRYR